MTQKQKLAPEPADDRKPPIGAELSAIEAARQRVRERLPRVTVRIKQDKAGSKIDLDGGDHTDHAGWLARLEDAFGTRGTSFAVSQLNMIIMAAQDDGKVDNSRVNAMLAMVEATRPANELQAALAVQMTLIHFATATVLRRAMRVDQIPQFDSTANMAVKFARTFAIQAETLAKLQRGGEQTVKVVHVHPGAQAIVGNVNAAPSAAREGGGGADESGNQPHAKAITAASSTGELWPLRSQDTQREPVPIASGQG